MVFLDAYRRRRTVAGVDGRGVGQGENLLSNPLDLLLVGAGAVSPADGARKQDVAGEKNGHGERGGRLAARRGGVAEEMEGRRVVRVPGDGQGADRESPNLKGFAVGDALGLLPAGAGGAGQEAATGEGLQVGAEAAGVVEVVVGEEDPGNFEFLAPGDFDDAVLDASRVDQCGLARPPATDEVDVCFVDFGNQKVVEKHGCFPLNPDKSIPKRILACFA